MNKAFTILSQAISIVLHPLFMPVYGMSIYLLSTRHRIPNIPNIYIWTSIVGTLFLTAIIPITLIFLLVKYGQVSSIEIRDANQRTKPYIYTLICFGFWCYFVRVTMHFPLVWLLITIGATLALTSVTLINYWWKISAHLIGIGGLLGGICGIALTTAILPTTLVSTILFLSLLLMYARLYLNAHTPLQVISGFLLGVLCTFIPCLIAYA